MVEIVLPLLVTGMLGFMFWKAAARLRHDRIKTERELNRGKHGFTPRQRIRFLLNRAFHPRTEEEPWQNELKASLDRVSVPTTRD